VIKKFFQGLIPLILMLSLILAPGSVVSAASTSPTVSSQSPARGATGVSVSIQPNVNFSKAMNASTINSTNIQLMNGSTPITATVALSGTTRAIITPDAPLSYNTTYYIVVTTEVRDTLGNAMAVTYGSASTSGFTTTAPRAPTVISQYPARGAINVTRAVHPYIIFSKAMDYTTINSTTVQLLQNGAPVAASVSLSGPNVAIITPDNPLNGNTIYYLAVTTGAQDTTGMALARAYGSAISSKFTTATAAPPTILSVFPTDNTTGVPFNIQPYINFSRSMDSSTITSTNIQLLDGVTPVAITVTLSNYTRVVITPALPLEYSKTYSIVVGTGVKDAFGNALTSSSTTNFTTDSAVSPVISSIYPADTATGVNVEVQPCIIFSEVIDPRTINSNNIKLMRGATLIRSTVASYGAKIVMLSPQYPLVQNTAYSIVVSTGIKDASGNAMAAASTTNFTTGTAVSPVVSSQYPANGATAVPCDVKACLVFSKEMDPSTINSSNILLKNGTSTIRAAVSLFGKHTAVVTPLYALSNNTNYYLVATSAVKDIEGNALAAVYGSSANSFFTTATSTLTVLSQYPVDQAVNVPVNIQPCVVFSRTLDATTINTTNIQLLDGLTPVAITVALYDDNTVMIKPSAALTLNKVYSITAGVAVKDTAGNALASQATSTFTTSASNIAPTVTYQYPADNSSAVPRDVQVCLIFSAPMDPLTISSANIRLMDGTTPVTVTVVLYGQNTVIIKPAGSLTLNTVYTISLGAGVKDAGGNTLAETTTSFTTINP
jgi:hypothetical protein